MKEKLFMDVIIMQASFRGFQVRKQHSKILWSIGVIHKAIMSWRFKRRGFRGLYVMQEMEDGRQEMKETKQINREVRTVRFSLENSHSFGFVGLFCKCIST